MARQQYMSASSDPYRRPVMQADTPEAKRQRQLVRDQAAGRQGQGDENYWITRHAKTAGSLMANYPGGATVGAVGARHLARAGRVIPAYLAKGWQKIRGAKAVSSVDEARDIVTMYKAGKEAAEAAKEAATASKTAKAAAGAVESAKAAEGAVKAADAAAATSSLAETAVAEGIVSPWTVRAWKSSSGWFKRLPQRLDVRAKYVEANSMLPPEELGRMAKMDRAMRNIGDLFFGHSESYNPRRLLSLKDGISADIGTAVVAGLPAEGVTAVYRAWGRRATAMKKKQNDDLTPDVSAFRESFRPPAEAMDAKRFLYYMSDQKTGLLPNYARAEGWLGYYSESLRRGVDIRTGKPLSDEDRNMSLKNANRLEAELETLRDTLSNVVTNSLNAAHVTNYMNQAARYAAFKDLRAQGDSFDPAVSQKRFQELSPVDKLLLYNDSLNDEAYIGSGRAVALGE